MAEELVVESAEVTGAMRKALRRLWLVAFDGDFGETDAQNAFGGVHVLLTEGEAVLAHASAVPPDDPGRWSLLRRGVCRGRRMSSPRPAPSELKTRTMV